MFEIVGKYNRAIVYAERIDSDAYAQILQMCNDGNLAGSRIRLMPDTHAASGCTVGAAFTYDDEVSPSFIGSDIGCGMQVYELADREIDLSELDRVIRENIPSGARTFDRAIAQLRNVPLEELHCYNSIHHDTVGRSFGTLGGGNHFIEVDRATDGRHFLVIHSGSRKLGQDVSAYYNATAVCRFVEKRLNSREPKTLEPCELNSDHYHEEYYLSGRLLEAYLHDMKITVDYAAQSRRAMGEKLISKMKLHPISSFATIHNYIDPEKRIIRKGAVSAQAGEIFIVPINMKDGALICRGRGNCDWNLSAPHGSGRVLRRSEAKELVTLEEFKAEMEGVFTTSVNESTIDESPMAYRRIDEIINSIDPTAEVIERIKTVYNFKASSPCAN